MHRIVKTVAAALILVASASTGITLAQTTYYEYNLQADAPTIACWWYGAYEHSPDDILFLCERFQISRLFISLSTSEELENQTLNIIQECHAHAIEVHWLTLEAPCFVYEENHDEAISYITAILDFLDNNSIMIEGIHPNAEPPIFWNDTVTDSATFNEALALWCKIELCLDARLGVNRTLQFSTAICSCYHTVDGYITNGTAGNMYQYLDYLVPMTYHFVTAQEYMRNLEPLIAQAPLLFGICPESFETVENMETLIRKVSYHYRDNPNFLGFSIFNNRNLARMIRYDKIEWEDSADIGLKEKNYDPEIIYPVVTLAVTVGIVVIFVKSEKIFKNNRNKRDSTRYHDG